jgi:hypothetical protein
MNLCTRHPTTWNSAFYVHTHKLLFFIYYFLILRLGKTSVAHLIFLCLPISNLSVIIYTDKTYLSIISIVHLDTDHFLHILLSKMKTIWSSVSFAKWTMQLVSRVRCKHNPPNRSQFAIITPFEIHICTGQAFSTFSLILPLIPSVTSLSHVQCYFYLKYPYWKPDPNTLCPPCTYRTLLLPHFYVLSLGFGEMVPNLLVTGSWENPLDLTDWPVRRDKHS